MEVGANLPPLKSDLIFEKKRELQEYQEFKKQKQKFREEKRLQKLQEKMSRKFGKSQSPHKTSCLKSSEIEDSEMKEDCS
jgi:hypothetical protein